MNEAIMELIRLHCEAYNEKMRRFLAFSKRQAETNRDLKLWKLENGKG